MVSANRCGRALGDGCGDFGNLGTKLRDALVLHAARWPCSHCRRYDRARVVRIGRDAVSPPCAPIMTGGWRMRALVRRRPDR